LLGAVGDVRETDISLDVVFLPDKTWVKCRKVWVDWLCDWFNNWTTGRRLWGAWDNAGLCVRLLIGWWTGTAATLANKTITIKHSAFIYILREIIFLVPK
jgi:hypothetical protein